MSFAYVQGQEYQALEYFKNLLKVEVDPTKRTDLEKLIRKLEGEVSQHQRVSPENAVTARNSTGILAAA